MTGAAAIVSCRAVLSSRMIRLERASLRHTDIVGLLLVQLGRLSPDFFQMQRSNLFVEILGQHIDFVFVLRRIGEQADLRQCLVGEAGGHDETWIARGATQVDQTPLGENDDLLPIGEGHQIGARLDLGPPLIVERSDLNFAVEVADIADEAHRFHRLHVLGGDHIGVAGGGNEDVAARDRFFHGHDI